MVGLEVGERLFDLVALRLIQTIPFRRTDREEVRRDVKREQSPRREGAGNPERELNQAILQIRKELEELRKEVRLLRGERGERREGSEDRGERDDG